MPPKRSKLPKLTDEEARELGLQQYVNGSGRVLSNDKNISTLRGKYSVSDKEARTMILSFNDERKAAAEKVAAAKEREKVAAAKEREKVAAAKEREKVAAAKKVAAEKEREMAAAEKVAAEKKTAFEKACKKVAAAKEREMVAAAKAKTAKTALAKPASAKK